MMRLCQRIIVSTASEEILSAMSRQNQQSKLMNSWSVGCMCKYASPATSWGHAILVYLYITFFWFVADIHVTRYATLCSLVAHEDKFTDESQKLCLEKVGLFPVSLFESCYIYPFICSQMANNLIECFGDVIVSYLQTHYFQQASTGLTPNQSNLKAKSEKVDHTSGPSKIQTKLLSDLKTNLQQLYHHHLLQLRCNSHFVSMVMSDGSQDSAHVASTAAATVGEGVETITERKLGSVIYPTASLINHSCTPNAIFRWIFLVATGSFTITHLWLWYDVAG